MNKKDAGFGPFLKTISSTYRTFLPNLCSHLAVVNNASIPSHGIIY